MLNFYKSKSAILLSVFGKTLIRKGNFSGKDYVGITITGPGERSFIPHISIIGLTRKPISIGLPKGWSRVFTVSNIVTDPDYPLLSYKDDYVSFNYQRANCDHLYQNGRMEKHEVWVISNLIHIPSNRAVQVQVAPVYNKHGTYCTPEVFVKGIVELTVIFDAG